MNLESRMKKMAFIFILFLLLPKGQASIRLKSLARLSGLQENPITGYGLVIGLAGTGDSRRNKDTTQAISNVLQTFGVTISPKDINSRNTATVIVTTNMPSDVHTGDKLDINVASLGDAKSLLGGTLLATPLKGADNQIYALAQGPVSIGGFKYDKYGNVIQKNHPTTGIIPDGAIVEKTLYNDVIDKTGEVHLILNHPDFTTADHIEGAINKRFGPNTARARSAQDIEIHPPTHTKNHFIHFVSQLEHIIITPDNIPTVVVNERTGVVIAGADARIDAVTISQGNLHIAIATEYQVSQPTFTQFMSKKVRTAVIPATNISVQESVGKTIYLKRAATVADLIAALTKAETTTQDIISILESLKKAGALHAELLVQ
jgi:flagellar P-ring protein FlgI